MKAKKENTMENKLVSYIMSLTPEQVEKLVNQLPRLTASLSGQDRSCPREQTAQIQ
jgi:hypothetical protein